MYDDVCRRLEICYTGRQETDTTHTGSHTYGLYSEEALTKQVHDTVVCGSVHTASLIANVFVEPHIFISSNTYCNPNIAYI